ncbi:putative CocE/NonD family hydrolase [Nocardia kruczakiae]|uniref:CocE/NonD family hydrolase n=1 Tax=Nocardia kruczakiae TaxID=261477 RepID=A0ABU1X9V4_9NOCA|nr:CocE/NonD family hydrolase [Nocardia kruczakiae]MDR7167320.1 putative CocE/NonD family hydrolase [Nocardia kruczakiae]
MGLFRTQVPWRAGLVAAVLVVTGAVAVGGETASAAPGPSEPLYGVGKQANVGVVMDDGARLSANVLYPTTASGAPAEGPFPVLLVQTPYDKNLPTLGGEDDFYVKRGYIQVVADMRGRGGSEGNWDFWGAREGKDGANLVEWAARLPHSNGKVGTLGCSALGITQLATANAVGPNSPLKTIAPACFSGDVYRDAVRGGLPNLLGLAVVASGLFTATGATGPVTTWGTSDPTRILSSELNNLSGVDRQILQWTTESLTNGDRLYDGEYWKQREFENFAPTIVRNGITVLMWGGWFDQFQNTQSQMYSSLQNAWAGRPYDSPMEPGQRASGRYQLFIGPWEHPQIASPDWSKTVQLAWYDRWLKGVDNGIDKTTTPLHMTLLGTGTGTGSWYDTSTYPLTGAEPTTFWFGDRSTTAVAPSTNNGSLQSTAPTAATGADSLQWLPESVPCNQQNQTMPIGDPLKCRDNDLLSQVGALTYTSAPMERDRIIAGPSNVKVFTRSTTKDAILAASLEIVSPDGSKSNAIASGRLRGQLRTLDRSRTWFTPAGTPWLPYQPLTRDSLQPMSTTEINELDIALDPVFARIPQGYSLRITVRSNEPNSLIPQTMLPDLEGGNYEVQRNDAAASFAVIPLADPATVQEPCVICN